eukprot:TRINITY_DN112526_c0_g1_i1.p1 TRINITY_DN112526_c0_g1~~TRINITY_DN112526_c0_g1_i1.p1  ORF type:complete len:753 (+),score=83.47 TRINITY_DN112526_c0_g1_i1:165-2261(+)
MSAGILDTNAADIWSTYKNWNPNNIHEKYGPTPTTDAAGNIYYVANQGQDVVATNNLGASRWRKHDYGIFDHVETAGNQATGLRVMTWKRCEYWACANWTALDGNTGKELWTVPGFSPDQVGSFTTYDGDLYIVIDMVDICHLDGKTGKVVRCYNGTGIPNKNNFMGFNSPRPLTNGKIIVGLSQSSAMDDGRLIVDCWQLSTGKHIYNFTTSYTDFSNMQWLLTNSGVLVIADDSEHSMALSPQGMVMWSFSSGSLIAPLAYSVSEDKLFGIRQQGCCAYYIAEFDTKTGKPMDMPGITTVTRGHGGIMLDELAGVIYFSNGVSMHGVSIESPYDFTFNVSLNQYSTAYGRLEPLIITPAGELIGAIEEFQTNGAATYHLGLFSSSLPPPSPPNVNTKSAIIDSVGLSVCFQGGGSTMGAEQIGVGFETQIRTVGSPKWKTINTDLGVTTTCARIPTNGGSGKQEYRIGTKSTTGVSWTNATKVVVPAPPIPSNEWCPKTLYFNPRSGGIQKHKVQFAHGVPQPSNPSVSYPGNSEAVVMKYGPMSCAVVGTNKIEGWLMFQETSEDEGHHMKVKARATYDFDGDGVGDEVLYYPSASSPGEDVYVFSKLYDGVYLLDHDNDFTFSFGTPSKNFTGGSIEIAVWIAGRDWNGGVEVEVVDAERGAHFVSHPKDSVMTLPFYLPNTKVPQCPMQCGGA